ncbi:MAG: ABC transporter substrate-binding protein [Dehalococcoidia bacterium]|nr:ABC transporter substrate-binding protein [Dehalococcoidia bacterium]
MIRWYRHLSATGLIVTILATACGGGAAAPTATATKAVAAVAPTATAVVIPRGGTLTLGMIAVAPPLDPDLSRGSNVWEVTNNVYDLLLHLGEDRQVKPHLLESWDLVDGKDYVFHLRKGVKFHDGTNFNAVAVKAKFDRMIKMGALSRARGYLSEPTGAAVVDEYTLKVTLSTPSAALISFLTTMPGFVYSPAALAAQGGEAMEKPVGAGPFRFVELVLDSHITLERSPDYWEKDAAGQQLPYLDRVRYVMINDPTVRLANLRTGDADASLYMRAPEFPRIAADPNLRLVRAALEDPTVELRIWRGHAPYDNRFNIKALAFAIDREAIAQGLYQGAYLPAKGYITPGQWAYDPDFKGYYLDLALSRGFLTEAGNPTGFKSKIEIGAGDLPGLRVAEAIQSQVAKVGIVLDIETVEAAALTKRTQDGSATLVVSRNVGFGPDPAYLMKQPFHTKGGFNVHLGGAGKPYTTPGYDELIDKAGEPRTTAERTQLYREAQRLIFDWGTNRVPIVYGGESLAHRVGVVGGFSFAPGGLLLLHRVWVDRR